MDWVARGCFQGTHIQRNEVCSLGVKSRGHGAWGMQAVLAMVLYPAVQHAWHACMLFVEAMAPKDAPGGMQAATSSDLS